MPNNNIKAMAARFLPQCCTGVGAYMDDLRRVCLNCTKPDIVVGVSQGGAVAMSLVQKEWQGSQLLLIAPAWKTFGVNPVVPSGTVILHSTNDWIVPVSDSRHLAKKNDCTLVQVKDGHNLDNSYGLILGEVDQASIRTGKHKPQEVIKAEWEEYRLACDEWRQLNCTKNAVTISSYYGVKHGCSQACDLHN